MDEGPLLDAIRIAHGVVWSTVTTVDGGGRPRARVLHPVWERDGVAVGGWVLTRPTPVKTRHLASNPHLTCSYLATNHDFAHFDCVAEWADDPHERARVWKWIATMPPPVGYDPATIFPGGPATVDMRVLRLRPYRVQVAFGADLARGQCPRLWRAAAA